MMLGAMMNTYALKQNGGSQAVRAIDLPDDFTAGMQLLINDLLRAGCNPTGVEGIGIRSAHPGLIRFTADRNGDGDVADPGEDVTYAFDESKFQIIRTNPNAKNASPVAKDIRALSFKYYDRNNHETTRLAMIRKIRVQAFVGAQSGSRKRSVLSEVTPRWIATNTARGKMPATEAPSTIGPNFSDSSVLLVENTTAEEVTTPPAAVPDTTGPAIDYIIQEPNGRRVPQNVPIEISVDVRDPSGIAGVALKTSPDGELVMTPDGLGSYRISVPPHNLQTVTYSIVAEDLLGNTSTSAAYQFFQNG